jgi:hypothetical protein
VPLAGGTTKQVAVLLGNGDGSLKTVNPYNAAVNMGDAPTAIAAKDLNGDGLADLVVTLNGTTMVAVLLSQAGTFPSALYYAAGVGPSPNPRGLALDDLDGDGNPDIVVTNQNDNTISVLLNRFQ